MDYDNWLEEMELRNLEYEEQKAENDRKHQVSLIRMDTPCYFQDGFSHQEFAARAHNVAVSFFRIKKVRVNGPYVTCTVQSQTTLTEWEFWLDFNNWGHVDGSFWTHSGNSDSSIPKQYGLQLSGEIHSLINFKGVQVDDLAEIVDKNKDLGTAKGLCTGYREGFWKRTFGRMPKNIHVMYDSLKIIGEHIYPVISMLKENGFLNIVSVPIPDIDDNSRHFVYETAQIVIGGTSFFEIGEVFPENIPVIITYHTKKEIEFSFPEHRYKRGDYVAVGDWLQELGFTQIYERKIPDLITGIITKDGSVESILIDIDGERPIEKGKKYLYDSKIIICYHTFK